MSRRTERVLLATLLLLFVALGVTYSLVVPPFEASDELWHYPMVKTIADNWRLPVQDPANVGPWRQEGSQPPLYYLVGALATAWIDTSDMAQVRHLNPHVDNGVATPDGNINLIVHNPELEAFPWRGTVLAVHLLRLLSVLMSAAAVYLSWLVVREVLPGSPFLALGTAAVHAFTPMVAFIAGAVNNDNLVMPLSNLALLMLLRLVKDQPSPVSGLSGREAAPEGSSDPRPGSVSDGPRRAGPRSGLSDRRKAFVGLSAGRYLALGCVLGLAVLTKTSSLALTLLTAVVVVVRAVRRRSWAEFLAGGLGTLLPVLGIGGWWYLRNLRLYGDPTGLDVFVEILGKRDVPADLAQLWRERFSFAAGYWGNFGGLNVPMAGWAYGVLNALAVVAALGLFMLLVKTLASSLRAGDQGPGAAGGLGVRPWAFALCLLWGLGVAVPWALAWASITWSSQGRLVFPAITVWSLLLTLGWTGWLPRRWRRWVLAGLVLFLFSLSAMAPFAWIRPAYASPEPLTGAQVAAIPHRLEIDFGGVMRLLGYDLPVREVRPGEQVEVTLYWEALAPADRDYTVFVHLLGEADLLVAQRDTFPGLGRLSMTWLQPGLRWADRYVLRVPATACAPDLAQIEVGLYDTVSGARVPAVTPDGEAVGDHVRFGRVEVCARAGEVPNPISVNFGDRMALTGYELDRRVAPPGGEITLTLYWQGLSPMDVNYTVSTQLVGPDQRKAAQEDAWPQGGAAPTASWQPGELVVEERALSIYPGTPPGVYDVQVVVYVMDQGDILRLPVIPDDGEMLSDHVVLTRVRVTR